MADEKKPTLYWVQVTREGCILATLVIPADNLWPEIITLFGKACLALEPNPSFQFRIEIEIRPQGQ